MDNRGSVQDRRAIDPLLTALGTRITGLEEGHTELKAAVSENTVLTKKIEASTSGLVEAWEALSGGLKVLNFLGKVAKWATYIAGAVTAVWGAWHVATSGVDIPR